MQEIFGSIKLRNNIRLNPAHINILLILGGLVLLCFLTIAKVHGSSIGVLYTHLYGNQFPDPNLIYGTPRAIRSDEWNITTPLAASQSWNNYEIFNQFSNGGQKLSIPLDIPSKDWITIFKPYNWSFFILPFENAFAFRWWFRAELLIFVTFLFLWKITNKDYFLSLIGSLIIFFTPFNHWWYSGSAASPIDALTYALLILFFTINLFQISTLKYQIINTVLLIFSSLCFFFLLYPPFQISIGLFLFIFLSSYILQNQKYLNLVVFKKILIHINIIIFCCLIILVYFLISHNEIISLIRNTAYPGHRLISGGDFTVIEFFSGFYNSYLLTPSEYTPPIFMNKSEASSFLMFYPFLLPIILFSFTKRKFNFINAGLVIYLLMLTAWIFIKFPPIIGKLSLFNQIPENRLILGVGFANYLLAINYLVSPQVIKTFTLRNYAFFLALIAAIFHIIIGVILLESDYFFFKSNYIPFFGNYSFLIFLAVTVYISVYTLIARHKKSWLFIVLAISIYSTFSINPLYKGLDLFQNSKTSYSLRQIAQTNPEGYWVVYDNFLLSNLLTGNQIKTLTGVSLYPKKDILKILDPTNLHNNIHNRFSYISFGNGVQNNIEFKLTTPDSYVIYIHPCQQELDSLNIKYAVFNIPQKEKCLELIKAYDYLEKPIYVYRRI